MYPDSKPVTSTQLLAGQHRFRYSDHLEPCEVRILEKTLPVFILGAGLGALAMVRSLGRRGIPVYVFDTTGQDIAYNSRYAKSVTLPNGESFDSVVRKLIRLAHRLGQTPILFMTSDHYMLEVSRLRDDLSDHFRFLLPQASVVKTVVDKSLFACFAKAHGFPVPFTLTPKTSKEIAGLSERLNYPVLIKPAISSEWMREDFRERFGLRKAVVVSSPRELAQRWMQLHGTSRRLVIQEMIPGPENLHFNYYSYRRDRDSRSIGLVYQKLRAFPIRNGAATFLRVVQNGQLAEISERILTTLGFTGISSVCFKKDMVSGEYKIYEINGRMLVCNSVYQMCGIDLPYIMYRDLLNGGESSPSLRNIGAKWVALSLDLAAFWSYWRSGEVTLLAWLRSLPGTRMCAEFALDDPKPFLYIPAQLFRSARRYSMYLSHPTASEVS